jgi:hypothetical protein
MKLVKLLLFVVLATANSGGYRYGDGDQAFYQPATELRLHPELFPRDRALIESQARLTVVDETLAAASRVTRLDLPLLFFVLYLATLVAMFFAAEQLAHLAGLSSTATGVFLTLLTLKHRIAKTGANTLEGYMHPRQLAFALGVFAFTASLKRRWLPAALCGIAAAAIHPTTALWWAIAVGATIALRSAGRQRALMGAALLSLVAGTLLIRPLGLTVMDEAWVRVLDSKDYVFASGWPAYAWFFNLAYLPLILLIAKYKNDARFTAPAVALFALFVASYSFTEAHVALAVQLQLSRVFWLLDFFLALLGAWLLIDSPFVRRSGWIPRAAITAAALLAVGRGLYTLNDAGATHGPVQIHLKADDWTEAMTWINAQPADWMVLAHPDHAWLYGPSVRVAASRDVVVESVKDSAISMYDRDVAMRTAERLAAVSPYDTLDAARARAIGAKYGASVVVAETARPIDLPLLHRNATFSVYDIR